MLRPSKYFCYIGVVNTNTSYSPPYCFCCFVLFFFLIFRYYFFYKNIKMCKEREWNIHFFYVFFFILFSALTVIYYFQFYVLGFRMSRELSETCLPLFYIQYCLCCRDFLLYIYLPLANENNRGVKVSVFHILIKILENPFNVLTILKNKKKSCWW